MNKTILLIEDNADIRGNMAELLSFANYTILTAEDGKAGVTMAIQQKPDLIVCDIMMPVLDGYSVIHMLQKNPETRHIPFIFLTAKTEREDIRKGMNLGADDYLIKPFDETELLNAIESRFKKMDSLALKFSAEFDGQTNESEISGKLALQNLVAEHAANIYRKRIVIYSESSRPVNVFYIQKGTVKTFKVNEDGKELTTGLYGQGEFFGYAALLEKTNYKESAETIEDADIVCIPRSRFEELLNRKEVLQEFVQLLAGNVTDRERQLLHMAYNSLRKKVAETLLALCERYDNKKGGPVIIEMTRDSLASIAGTAKESLIRTLSDFKDEQIIDIQNTQIKILSEKKLRDMLN